MPRWVHEMRSICRPFRRSLVLANLFPMFIVYLFDVCANGRHIAFIIIIIIGQDPDPDQDQDQEPGQCKQVMSHVVLATGHWPLDPVRLGANWQLSDWERNYWPNLGIALFSGPGPGRLGKYDGKQIAIMLTSTENSQN